MNETKPTDHESNETQKIDDSDNEKSTATEIEEKHADQLHETADDGGSEIALIEELQAEIQRLNEELSSAKDQSLRAAAEVDNIRRRSSNEQINIRKFAIEGFASELLAVKDSLDLAEQVELSADNKDVIDKMHEGLSLTLKQLDRAFEKFSIQVIAPEKGEKLDPESHQAMTVQQTDEVDNNCVLTTIQKGYKLHDRLLRPAMVVIARTPEEKKAESEQESA